MSNRPMSRRGEEVHDLAEVAVRALARDGLLVREDMRVLAIVEGTMRAAVRREREATRRAIRFLTKHVDAKEAEFLRREMNAHFKRRPL